MQGDGLSEHIFSHAPHLYSVRREESSTVAEGAALKAHRVVTLVHDKHTNETLISIHDEIAAKFVHVFARVRQLLFGHVIQIAVFTTDHHWHIA